VPSRGGELLEIERIAPALPVQRPAQACVQLGTHEGFRLGSRQRSELDPSADSVPLGPVEGGQQPGLALSGPRGEQQQHRVLESGVQEVAE